MTLARLHDVTLAYGDHVAVRGLDLVVDPGELVTLVGGDGAGKSTTLRALSGRLAPSSGEVSLPDGDDTGVMPSRGATWGDLTVDENLAFVRDAHGTAAAATEDLLDRMQLTVARRRLARDLSGGMRQKLALAMAVQHQPRLLVLDEPTTGVDPVSRAAIWRLLGEEISRGTGIVLATTYLDEAERSTRIVLLDAGRVLAAGSPGEVAATTPGAVVAADVRFGARSWRRGPVWHSWLVEHEVAAAVADHGARRVEPDLEDAAIVRSLAQEVRA